MNFEKGFNEVAHILFRQSNNSDTPVFLPRERGKGELEHTTVLISWMFEKKSEKRIGKKQGLG